MLYHGQNEQVYVVACRTCKLVATVCSFLQKGPMISAEEQLHLSESIAYRSCRDMVLRLDMHTLPYRWPKTNAEGTVEEDVAYVGADEQQILIDVEGVGRR